MERTINHVTIIGMGALGVLYGDHFLRKLGGSGVSFFADQKRIETYQKQDIRCNGKPCAFSFQDVAVADKPAQLLIFAVKSTALLSAIDMTRDFVDENTIIISVLNGISSEGIIEKELGKGIVIPCIAQGMDAVKSGSQVTYSKIGDLCLGISEQEKLPALQQITSFFDRVQLPYVVEPDIRKRIWGKWMLNVGLNQTVMVWEGNYGTVQQPGEARETMIAAMREVLSLAKAEQVPISEADLEEYLVLTDGLSPEGMPSMRQDGLAKRNTEVELFSGTVIRKAEQYGIDVPVNRYFYQKIKEMENSRDNQ